MGPRKRQVGGKDGDATSDGGGSSRGSAPPGSGLPVGAIVGVAAAVIAVWLLLTSITVTNTDESLVRMEQAGRNALIRVSLNAEPAPSSTKGLRAARTSVGAAPATPPALELPQLDATCSPLLLYCFLLHTVAVLCCRALPSGPIWHAGVGGR